jgi:hypothetical protein
MPSAFATPDGQVDERGSACVRELQVVFSLIEAVSFEIASIGSGANRWREQGWCRTGVQRIEQALWDLLAGVRSHARALGGHGSIGARSANINRATIRATDGSPQPRCARSTMDSRRSRPRRHSSGFTTPNPCWQKSTSAIDIGFGRRARDARRVGPSVAS